MKDEIPSETVTKRRTAILSWMYDGHLILHTHPVGVSRSFVHSDRKVEQFDSDYPFWLWVSETRGLFDSEELGKIEVEYAEACAANPELLERHAKLGGRKRFVQLGPEIKIDTWKSLAELSGVDWGPPPELGRVIVQERHRLRRVQMVRLSHEELIMFLKLGFKGDSRILVPVAIARLRREPWAGHERRIGGLLCAVLQQSEFPWRSYPDAVKTIRLIKDNTLRLLAKRSDQIEPAKADGEIAKWHAKFEERLASV